MKMRINILISFFVLSFVSSQAQTMDQYPYSQISASAKSKIDSIIQSVKRDKHDTALVFFNIDFMFANAYGEVLNYEAKRIEGELVKIIGDSSHHSAVMLNPISSDSQLLAEFFTNPTAFLRNYKSSSPLNISHDNAIFLLLKINGKILFNEFFMRSSILTTPNQKFGQLILVLGDI